VHGYGDPELPRHDPESDEPEEPIGGDVNLGGGCRERVASHTTVHCPGYRGARAGGFSKGYLSRIENGLRLPSLQALEQIAEALAVEVRDLLIFPERSSVDAAMEALRQAGEAGARKVLRKLRER
jgi:transcriptional regulator with XRE-family HTH domain